MKVALIIGHSKNSQGASNRYMRITEFMFNDWLVKDIIKYFDIISDIEVELIPVYRNTYKHLPKMVNDTDAKFSISFHCNAFNTKVSGSEVLYYHKSKNGKRMAEIFQTNIVNALGLKDRGIKGVRSEDRGGYLLKYTVMPTILVESFFIDSDFDCSIVRMKYEKIVLGFINSICQLRVLI